jgi:hypothetical protein
LNTTLGIFSKSNVKAINELSKQVELLSQNIGSPGKEKTKDFVRREDPMKRIISNIDDLEKNQREQIRLEKSKKTDSGKGLLGLLAGLGAAALGLSGIVGYLMTGKTDMLFSTIKGLTNYSH